MRTAHYSLLITGLAIGALSFGCNHTQDTPKKNTSPQTTAQQLPDNLFVDTPPASPRGVRQLKAADELEGEVVVFGRIGGRVNPYVHNNAVFLLADDAMKDCSELHGDSCPTPWDYCCEPKDSLNASLATIQIVGEDNRPLRIDLSEHDKLKPSTRLTIAGEVASHEPGSNLVINARKIHVQPAGS